MELFCVPWTILAELFFVQNFSALSALSGGVGWGYLNSSGRSIAQVVHDGRCLLCRDVAVGAHRHAAGVRQRPRGPADAELGERVPVLQGQDAEEQQEAVCLLSSPVLTHPLFVGTGGSGYLDRVFRDSIFQTMGQVYVQPFSWRRNMDMRAHVRNNDSWCCSKELTDNFERALALCGVDFGACCLWVFLVVENMPWRGQLPNSRRSRRCRRTRWSRARTPRTRGCREGWTRTSSHLQCRRCVILVLGVCLVRVRWNCAGRPRRGARR